MKLVVGLGNPGEKYEGTRHNVGFLVADVANSKLQITNHKQILNSKFKTSKRLQAEMVQIGEVIIAKPITFMNKSGESVRKIMDFYKLNNEDVYVIHDDLDIKLGEYKIQLGKGPKVHYGIESVEKCLVTDQFWRVRVGVENRSVRGNMGIPGMKYVLQKFTKDEQEILDEVVSKIVQELVGVIS